MGDGLVLLVGNKQIPHVKVTDMIDRVRIESKPGEVIRWASELRDDLANSGGRQVSGSSFILAVGIYKVPLYNYPASGNMETGDPMEEKEPTNIREIPRTLDYKPILPVLLPAADPDRYTAPRVRCHNDCVAVVIGKNWDISAFLERFKVRANDHAETEPYKRFGLSYNRWLASGLSVVVTGGAEQFIRGTEFKGRLDTTGSTQVDVVVEK